MKIIYSIFSKIIDYFKYYYGPDKKELKVDDKHKENTISFSVDEWNRFIIRIKLDIATSTSYEEFGKMLYYLNSGKYEQNMVDTLLDISKKSKIESESIQKVMSGWAILLAFDLDSKKEPYVKPTQVFSK